MNRTVSAPKNRVNLVVRKLNLKWWGRHQLGLLPWSQTQIIDLVFSVLLVLFVRHIERSDFLHFENTPGQTENDRVFGRPHGHLESVPESAGWDPGLEAIATNGENMLRT